MNICKPTLDANTNSTNYPCGLGVPLRILYWFGEETVEERHLQHHEENHDHGENWGFIVHREMVDNPILLCATPLGGE